MFRTSPVHLQERFIIHLLHELTVPTLIQTYFILQHIPNLHIQLVQNAPDDGPVRSETCRANICDEQTHSLKHSVYPVGLHVY